jgi:hypothetical protein
VGAADIDAQGAPQILDRKTPLDPGVVEIRVHAEEVTEADRVRSRPREPGEPEVRIRSADQKQWEQVKRLEPED